MRLQIFDCRLDAAHLDLAFTIADRLMGDQDDLVQKGYGWLLKEASKTYPTDVFDFVMSRRERMPRIAFRYALEKLPDDLRQTYATLTHAAVRCIRSNRATMLPLGSHFASASLV